MKRSLAASLLLLTLASVSATALAGSKEDAIAYRQSTMVMLKWYLGPMGAMVKGELPFDAQAFQMKAEALAKVASLELLPAFPPGSDDEFDSSAKRKIWADWEAFNKKFATLQSESALLAKVAASGDQVAIKQQFAATAKSCKGCHETYRSKR